MLKIIPDFVFGLSILGGLLGGGSGEPGKLTKFLRNTIGTEVERRRVLEEKRLADEAKKKKRKELAGRQGRRASILTSASGIEDQLGLIKRPEARSATLLGGF